MHRAAAVVIVCLLAGCSSGPPSGDPMPEISWGPMDVATTASEPFELQGFIRVAWADGVFAIDSEKELDLPRFTQREGDVFYTSDRGLGWTEVRAERLEVSRDLSNRVLVWDLPRLLEPPFEGTVDEEGGMQVVRGNTTVRWFAQDIGVAIEVFVDKGHAVRAVVTSPSTRESPFTFTDTNEPLSFDVGLHEPSRPASDVEAMDRDARTGHKYIGQLVRDHVARRGQTPEQVDPQSLALERSLRGEPWPENPYDGALMRDAFESGHFTWARCSAQDATLLGNGWDGVTTFLTFGRGCGE